MVAALGDVLEKVLISNLHLDWNNFILCPLKVDLEYAKECFRSTLSIPFMILKKSPTCPLLTFCLSETLIRDCVVSPHKVGALDQKSFLWLASAPSQ